MLIKPYLNLRLYCKFFANQITVGLFACLLFLLSFSPVQAASSPVGIKINDIENPGSISLLSGKSLSLSWASARGSICTIVSSKPTGGTNWYTVKGSSGAYTRANITESQNIRIVCRKYLVLGSSEDTIKITVIPSPTLEPQAAADAAPAGAGMLNGDLYALYGGEQLRGPGGSLAVTTGVTVKLKWEISAALPVCRLFGAYDDNTPISGTSAATLVVGGNFNTPPVNRRQHYSMACVPTINDPVGGNVDELWLTPGGSPPESTSTADFYLQKGTAKYGVGNGTDANLPAGVGGPFELHADTVNVDGCTVKLSVNEQYTFNGSGARTLERNYTPRNGDFWSITCHKTGASDVTDRLTVRIASTSSALSLHLYIDGTEQTAESGTYLKAQGGIVNVAWSAGGSIIWCTANTWKLNTAGGRSSRQEYVYASFANLEMLSDYEVDYSCAGSDGSSQTKKAFLRLIPNVNFRVYASGTNYTGISGTKIKCAEGTSTDFRELPGATDQTGYLRNVQLEAKTYRCQATAGYPYNDQIRQIVVKPSTLDQQFQFALTKPTTPGGSTTTPVINIKGRVGTAGNYSSGPLTPAYGGNVELQLTRSGTPVPSGCSLTDSADPTHPDANLVFTNNIALKTISNITTPQRTFTFKCTSPSTLQPKVFTVNVNIPASQVDIKAKIEGQADPTYSDGPVQAIVNQDKVRFKLTFTGVIPACTLKSDDNVTNLNIDPPSGVLERINATNLAGPFSKKTKFVLKCGDALSDTLDLQAMASFEVKDVEDGSGIADAQISCALPDSEEETILGKTSGEGKLVAQLPAAKSDDGDYQCFARQFSYEAAQSVAVNKPQAKTVFKMISKGNYPSRIWGDVKYTNGNRAKNQKLRLFSYNQRTKEMKLLEKYTTYDNYYDFYLEKYFNSGIKTFIVELMSQRKIVTIQQGRGEINRVNFIRELPELKEIKVRYEVYGQTNENPPRWAKLNPNTVRLKITQPPDRSFYDGVPKDETKFYISSDETNSTAIEFVEFEADSTFYEPHLGKIFLSSDLNQTTRKIYLKSAKCQIFLGPEVGNYKDQVKFCGNKAIGRMNEPGTKAQVRYTIEAMDLMSKKTGIPVPRIRFTDYPYRTYGGIYRGPKSALFRANIGGNLLSTLLQSANIKELRAEKIEFPLLASGGYKEGSMDWFMYNSVTTPVHEFMHYLDFNKGGKRRFFSESAEFNGPLLVIAPTDGEPPRSLAHPPNEAVWETLDPHEYNSLDSNNYNRSNRVELFAEMGVCKVLYSGELSSRLNRLGNMKSPTQSLLDMVTAPDIPSLKKLIK